MSVLYYLHYCIVSRCIDGWPYEEDTPLSIGDGKIRVYSKRKINSLDKSTNQFTLYFDPKCTIKVKK